MNDLDALIRRVDVDRWLASRFASADVRKRLLAVYAVNYEIARTGEVVKEPGLGDIRLEWWRSALGDVHENRAPPPHPAVAAYAAAHRETPLPRPAIEALIAAHRRDLDAQPFETALQFDAYLDATAGGVMRMAIAACGHAQAPHDTFLHAAGWLWGCVGLLRAAAHWSARSRSFIPREGGSSERLLQRAEDAARELRALPALPAAMFPALGYVALSPGYLKALRRGRNERPLLARQIDVIAAAATGRL